MKPQPLKQGQRYALQLTISGPFRACLCTLYAES